MSQLILVGEVVAHITVKSLLKGVPQPLGQVFGRRPHGQSATFRLVNPDDPAEGIVLDSPFRLVVEQATDLLEVFGEERPVEMDIAAGDPGALRLTGWTDDAVRRTKMGMLLAIGGLTRT